MNWLRCVLVLLLATAAVMAPTARAGTTCSAEMTDLDFGLVDPANQSTTATINYECDTKGGGGTRTTVRMCFAIGAGIVPGSTEADRLMTQLFVDSLPFDIYKDAGHSQIWGNDASSPSHLEYVASYSLNNGGNGKTKGSIPVYGHIPDLWGAAAGTYGSIFWDTGLTFRFNDSQNPANDPVACDSGPGQSGTSQVFPFWAWARLPQRCDVRATPMDFGTTSNSTGTGNLASTSTISLECTNRMAWQVGLSNGLHFDGSSRRLYNGGGAYIRYQLNRPPSDGGGPWGNTLDADTVARTSSDGELTVHGVILDQPLVQAGTYSDTITVTVTY